jgi:hypothetical protein
MNLYALALLGILVFYFLRPLAWFTPERKRVAARWLGIVSALPSALSLTLLGTIAIQVPRALGNGGMEVIRTFFLVARPFIPEMIGIGMGILIFRQSRWAMLGLCVFVVVSVAYTIHAWAGLTGIFRRSPAELIHALTWILVPYALLAWHLHRVGECS